MRIVHIDLTGPFTEKMNYQENLLADIHAKDGHEVFFIATNFVWEDNEMCTVLAADKKMENGVFLIRIPYVNLLLPILTNKLRVVKGLGNILEELKPEIIMLHGYQTAAVFPIVKYVKKNPNVKLAVDTHADALNSAQNFISRQILHRFLYTYMGHKVLDFTKKIWCISKDVMDFSEKMNRIPNERLDFYPLGGQIFEKEEYYEKRNRIREKYGIYDKDILLVHSGKMDAKKKTFEIVKAIAEISDTRLKLFIVGTMDGDVEREVRKLTDCDERVSFTGWMSGEELLEVLCGADIYMQPGTQSATMQNAACCACALALYPYESHQYLLGDSAFYVKDYEDIKHLLWQVLENPELIEAKRRESFIIAKEKLDYKKLAEKLYEL